MAIAEEHGIACSTVSDGHVLVFSKETLLSFVEECGTENYMVVFIKRPEFALKH